MHFMHVLFGVVYFLMINIQTVHSPDPATDAAASSDPTTTTDANADRTPADKHTFVALLDILFTDATKRYCTGAVIHNNVVLTAAHCFIDRNAETLLPELTLSFVVIGTKKMFDASYEHYLPIERVTSHPKFKGWTADLALVYTFAGIATEKPGKIIPLAGGTTQTPVDSNVTVLSWGRCHEDGEDEVSKTRKPGRTNSNSNEDDVRKRSEHTINVGGGQQVEPEGPPLLLETRLKDKSQSREDGNDNVDTEPPRRLPLEEKSDEVTYIKSSESRRFATTAKKSQYTLSESVESQKKNKPVLKAADPYDIGPQPADDEYYAQAGIKKYKGKKRNKRMSGGLESSKNWRRQMLPQPKNELTVEVFGFVNVGACKKIVERTMPTVFSIKNVNEILCYSSEDRYITNEDSGAPALHNGNLVAVTVGGVETDGDHVAIGMKMSCFCSWIAENLPDGDGAKIQCCQNCCDNGNNDRDDEEQETPAPQHRKIVRNGKKRKPIVRFDDGDAQGVIDKQLNEGFVKVPHTPYPPANMANIAMPPRFKSNSHQDPLPQPQYEPHPYHEPHSYHQQNPYHDQHPYHEPRPYSEPTPVLSKKKSHLEPLQPDDFGPVNSSFRSWYYV